MTEVGMWMFCLVSLRMSSPSIPPLPSEDLRERTMASAVSDTVDPDSFGIKKKLKLDGVLRLSQKRTPEWRAVARPAWRWMGSRASIESLW